MIDNVDADVNEKNIQIFVRVLPLKRSCESCAKIDWARKKIYIRCLQDMQSNRIAMSKKSSFWSFDVDDIFYDSSQEEVYRVTSEDLVSNDLLRRLINLLMETTICTNVVEDFRFRSFLLETGSLKQEIKIIFANLRVLDGVSCILMGYGQTGSGKSFTISGLRNNWEHRGLVARIISQMFAEKAHRKESSDIQYCVSYVELHGKEAKDLLAHETENRIRINDRDPFKDILMATVENEEEAIRKIFEGEVRRSTMKGSTYPVSHLATAVITFHVSNVSLITSWGVVTTAKMHIVEMAGTGTVGKNNCWKSAADVGMANLTMTQLEQFFSYLAGNRIAVNTPIRSNNLLKILGNAFSVSSIIRLISHIRIQEEDLIITLSTLKFTLKIAKLKPVKVKENVKYRPDLVLHRLQDEVNALKKELMINDLFLRQEALMNISKPRMEQINRSILNFLNGKISDFTLFNTSQAQILLKSIKELYNRLTAKELEVDRLKETYEDLINMLPVLPEKVSVSSDDQKSVEQDVQEPSEEANKEVGSLRNFGMTLGPYTEEEKQENVDTTGTVTSDQIHKIDISEVQQWFEHFLKENEEYSKTKVKLNKIEKTLVAAQQKFSRSIENYFQVKRNLENERDKLSKHQKLRQIMKPAICDYEVNDVPEIEKMIHRDVLCHQKALVNLEDEVKEEQDLINKLFEQHVELCSKLESGFREYCQTKNMLLPQTDKPMKMLLEQIDEKEASKMTRQKFTKFQRMILCKQKDPIRSRKVRFHHNQT